MKLIGIDYGTKRVGVALSDEDGSMAFPRTVLSNDASLLPELSALIKAEGVGAIVVGESKNLSGEYNTLMASIRRFADALKRECGLPVHFEPEFYTSKEARMLVEDTHPNKPPKTVDAKAAAVILNSYILKKRP